MPSNCVITIGVFDAIHRGHTAILKTGRSLADEAGVPLVVLTFDPHPRTFLRPGTEPPRLTTHEEKLTLLRQAGADRIEILTPSPELFALSPEAFIQKLMREHQPIAIVEGSNFCFGNQRSGDIHTLEELGKKYHYQTHIQPQMQVMLSDQLQVPVSSTLARWLVGCGRVADVARCLGRFYAISGPVTQGQQRGRTINVPTANLDLSACPQKLVPGDGVYAGLAELPDGTEYAAAISIGTKPTFDEQPLTVEAHLLDFAGDLYGKCLNVKLARWVRDQQTFPNLEALKAQLACDIALTRSWHAAGILHEIHQPAAL